MRNFFVRIENIDAKQLFTYFVATLSHKHEILKMCLDNQFYSDFAALCWAIDDCSEHVYHECKKEQEMLTLKFKTSKNVQFLAIIKYIHLRNEHESRLCRGHGIGRPYKQYK